MKGNEKIAVYLGTFIFVIVGYIISLIVSEILADVLSNLGIAFLTPARIIAIIFALAWFLVCFLTYFGSTRWLEEGEKVGILSPFFFILWLIASLAIVIGYIVQNLLQGSAAIITLDTLLNQFFTGLFWALAPTIAALLGVSNKASKSL